MIKLMNVNFTKTYITKKVILIILSLIYSLTACSQQDLVSKKVLSNKLNILIPKDFGLMSEDMLNAKYPIAGKRPSEVYTNATGSINIALNLTQNQVTQDKLPEVETALKNQFTSTSNITFNSSELRTINGHKYVILDFYSQAVDTKIYNLMFVTSLNNKMIIGTFNCTIEHLTQWKPIGQKIINSINIL
jgi:hypothetical protein